ncbi:MAG: carboxypeptidase-like regulatory domain-containing protein, partial [Candidatus Cloacimonetes bacterium]|nr:carboxypeptidase-like regulatory domain-containing protein [Candidatus Cloacimonadota bacterium]
MKYRRCLIIVFLVLYLSPLFSQKYTISGYVREETSGEELSGCNVYIKELSKGTTTNKYGFYSITIDKGKY